MPGVAVLGAVGGVGTTLVAAALALASDQSQVRVLGLDGLGGGPHMLWGVAPERTVDHLAAVRGEVSATHVQQVVHRQARGIELVAGPSSGLAPWQAGDAERLAEALTDDMPWVADLGRAGDVVQHAVLARALDVVVVTCASPEGVAAARQHVGALPDGRRWVVGLARRRDESLSPRAARRLLGAEVVELPWDRAGAQRCAAGGAPGRRGLWAAVAHLRHQLGADA